MSTLGSTRGARTGRRGRGARVRRMKETGCLGKSRKGWPRGRARTNSSCGFQHVAQRVGGAFSCEKFGRLWARGSVSKARAGEARPVWHRRPRAFVPALAARAARGCWERAAGGARLQEDHVEDGAVAEQRLGHLGLALRHLVRSLPQQRHAARHSLRSQRLVAHKQHLCAWSWQSGDHDQVTTK